ncbi:hypothetical protein GCM10011586_32380 [Silvibacterium dinghuense]|nr:hypothetical protein GCM10011586_32380 [Silvibacterium dinghuense]
MHTTIPAGTPLQVRLVRAVPVRQGEDLATTLVFPVYVDGALVLPAGTRVHGRIVELPPDHSRRVDARLNGDFTPFHKAVVQLDELWTADGAAVPLVTATANDGAPLLSLAPAPQHGGIIHQEWDAGIGILRGAGEELTAPGKGERLKQLLYSQLPYHPERLQAGTSWSVELTQPVDISLPAKPAAPVPSLSHTPSDSASGTPSTVGASGKTMLLHAYLDRALSSKDAKAGSTFEATLTQPVAEGGKALVPQGSVLVGMVTRARPAKSFGRAGVLRFDFRELRLPEGERKAVTGSLTGVETTASGSLQLDGEGQVKPQAPSRVIVPLAMVFLASRPLDSDGNQLAGATVGSNGIGLIGRVVGMASASRNLAAGIGFYGAAVSVYRRWLRRGREVEFPRFTRVDVKITEQTGRALRLQ